MLGVSPQSVLLISAMAELTGANCQPAKPLPILMINGTADQLLPYAGGLSVRGDSLWSAERLVGFFRRLNGCAEAAQQSVLPGGHPQKIEVERSTKCSGGPVILYRIVGGGHNVPPGLNAAFAVGLSAQGQKRFCVMTRRDDRAAPADCHTAAPSRAPAIA